MITSAKIGFVYKFECFSPDGKLLWEMEDHNLIPNEGRDYILEAALNNGTRFASWYIGLYEGAYAPQASDTMATISAASTEITAYTEALRVALTADPLSNGLYSNAGSPAEFTFSSTKTVRGGFISSSAVKGGTVGVLLSVVQASTAKQVAAGEILRVTAGLQLVTV